MDNLFIRYLIFSFSDTKTLIHLIEAFNYPLELIKIMLNKKEQEDLVLELVKLNKYKTIKKCISLKFKYDVNVCFYSACFYGYLELVKLMISYEAHGYMFGLYYACQKGHLEVVNLICNLDKETCYLAFTLSCANGHLEIVKAMIETVRENKYNKELGLNQACKNGHLEIAKLMISLGAKDNVSECKCGHKI